MTAITLTHGYYIESNSRGYYLKQKFQSKARDGTPKESIRQFGYFGDLVPAVEKCIKLIQKDYTDDETMTLHEYAKQVEEASENAVWAVIKIARNGGEQDGGKQNGNGKSYMPND